jgi:hypothetical protein
VGQTQGNYSSSNVLRFHDTIMSPANGAGPWDGYPLLAQECDPGTGTSVFDDFTNVPVTTALTGNWKYIKGTGGTVILSTTLSNGWINLPTAASANDYISLFSQQAFFAPSVLNDAAFEVMLNVTEASTNASAWWCGLTSVTTTGGLVAATGAPPASYSGAIFWKPPGALAVNFQTSNATVRSPTATTAITTAVSGTTLILGATINHNNGVTCLVTPYVSTVVANVRTPVVQGPTQNLVLASLANMLFGFGIVSGATLAETLTVDYALATCGRYYQ